VAPEYRPRTGVGPSLARTTHLAAVFVVVMALLAGCRSDDGGEVAAPPAAPRLDLETLEVEVPGGTLTAEARSGAFVGAVTDDVFVAVAFPDEVGPHGRVTVYLCDDEHGEWFSEQLDGGVLRIDGEQVTVAIELSGDEVSGSVTWRGQDLGEFTATEATGVAGLYAGGATFGGVDHSAAWVVLPDGRQRGYLGTCPPMPLHVCWTQPR
jgi:hypothetical protein